MPDGPGERLLGPLRAPPLVIRLPAPGDRVAQTAGGLVFIAATPDRRLRAIDVRDGRELWQAELPAAGYSTPVTYTAGGRQFVVIAAGGGRQGPPSGSEYRAFALP